jgi:tetratricopeptide (TPR) repeat protein
MVLYRTGAQKAAVEMLQGLLNSASGVNRLDLLRLLGEIYFEQGAYASASDCFRQAAFMQLKKANYWFALSCLDAGRKDDAAEAFSDVLPELGEADKIRVSVLIDGLKSGKFHNAAQRSDPEKSAYIKVNWNSLSDKQIVDLIYLVSDKESQQYLWQYAFDRAYRESLASRSQALFKFAKQEFGRKEKWIRQLNQNKGKYLEITRQFKALDEWMKSNGEETAHPFFKARLALESKDSAEAKKWYLVSIENQPFNLRQVGTAIHFLSQKQETRSLAYQKSLEISNLDPQNVEYLKLYAWLSLKEGLPEFAYQVLPKISLLTTPQVASDFRKKLDEELARKNYPGMPLP